MGKLIFANGSVYNGNFSKNEIDGKGHYVWPDGKQYIGDWVQNNM